MFSLCAASSMCLAQLIMPVRPPPCSCPGEMRLIFLPFSRVWFLIPRKPVPELIGHKSLSKWLLVEQCLSWGRGWPWAPLGLLLCC